MTQYKHSSCSGHYSEKPNTKSISEWASSSTADGQRWQSLYIVVSVKTVVANELGMVQPCFPKIFKRTGCVLVMSLSLISLLTLLSLSSSPHLSLSLFPSLTHTHTFHLSFVVYNTHLYSTWNISDLNPTALAFQETNRNTRRIVWENQIILQGGMDRKAFSQPSSRQSCNR